MNHHEYQLPEGPLNVETEPKFIFLRTKMQVDILMEYLIDHGVPALMEDTPEDLKEKRHELEGEWAQLYSKRFGDVLHHLVLTDPNLKEEIEKTPDVIYEKIKHEVYDVHDDHSNQVAA